MDWRVVNFGLGLEDKQKAQGNEGKVLHKHWVRRQVTSPSLYRKKRGLGVLTSNWLSGKTLNAVENALIRSPVLNSCCRIEGLKALFDARRDGAGSNREIGSLLQFALWYRIFVEQRGVIPELSEHLLDWL